MYVASPALEPLTPSGAGRSVNARERAAEPGERATDVAERAFPGERVTVSGAARAASAAAGTERASADGGGQPASSAAPASPGANAATGREGVPGVRGADRLDAREQALVAQLEARDAHVRGHEAAHQAAGGGLTGGASYTYELGPDGKEYAVGGEVPIRTGGGTTPDEKIADAERVRAAALAPADPSPQDLAVAAAALQTELTARAEKAKAAVRAYRRAAANKGGSAFTSAGADEFREASAAGAAPAATVVA